MNIRLYGTMEISIALGNCVPKMHWYVPQSVAKDASLTLEIHDILDQLNCVLGLPSSARLNDKYFCPRGTSVH